MKWELTQSGYSPFSCALIMIGSLLITTFTSITNKLRQTIICLQMTNIKLHLSLTKGEIVHRKRRFVWIRCIYLTEDGYLKATLLFTESKIHEKKCYSTIRKGVHRVKSKRVHIAVPKPEGQNISSRL